MAKIAFILLCHKDPEAIIAQAERLTAVGDCIAIHFDASAPAKAFDQIQNALKDNPNVAFAKKRVKCGWGEWSLVDATLQAVKAAFGAFSDATHFYMLSGDCMAIKSAAYTHAFLDSDDVDYIESFDFFTSDWIKTGMKEDRLIYRHYFNERQNKGLFYGSLNLQRRLGLTRKVPEDLEIMIGSQWWCLRRDTIAAVLDLTRARKDIMKFFATTWIPDETFFQTLVRHLVPEDEIRNRTLTFLIFSDYGMPVTFFNDHYDLLMAQGYLFARKISPEAHELKERLGELYADEEAEFSISDEGRTLYGFLTGRGRNGRRFAPRFWEKEATLGRKRELMIIACKKWHVAKRLAERIRNETEISVLEYIFNEHDSGVPYLGGIEASLEKRGRHRRALVRMLFDYFETDRLVICLDPSDVDLIRDFYADKSEIRLLEIECEFTDEYLQGHAQRVGLAGEQTPDDVMGRLLPTIRYDISHEQDKLRDQSFSRHYRYSEMQSAEENVTPIERFLNVARHKAEAISPDNGIFGD